MRTFTGAHKFFVSALVVRDALLSGKKDEFAESAGFDVGGYTFKVVLRPTDADTLGVHIRYQGPKPSTWAYWEISCINTKFPHRTIRRGWKKGDERNKFNRSSWWGWDSFASKQTLLDRDAGFISCASLQFEARIEVFKRRKKSAQTVHRLSGPTNLSAGLVEDMSEMLRTGDMHDIVFVLEGGKVEMKGHQQIFAARSSVFRRMFSGRFRESQQDGVSRVEVEDMKARTFGELRNFIYTGLLSSDLSVPSFLGDEKETEEGVAGPSAKTRRLDEAGTRDPRPASSTSSTSALAPATKPSADESGEPWSVDQMFDTYLELLGAADRYDVRTLFELCQFLLSEQMSQHTVIRLYEAAQRHSAPMLSKVCTANIVACGWELPKEELQDLPPDVLASLLSEIAATSAAQRAEASKDTNM